MKAAIILAASLALVPTAANATGGLVCKTAGPRPVEAAIVISHTAVPSVVSARLTDNARGVRVVVAQSWLEPNEVRLDLTDPDHRRHEARLRVKRVGTVYDGTLWRGGKRRWVRCRES